MSVDTTRRSEFARKTLREAYATYLAEKEIVGRMPLTLGQAGRVLWKFICRFPAIPTKISKDVWKKIAEKKVDELTFPEERLVRYENPEVVGFRLMMEMTPIFSGHEFKEWMNSMPVRGQNSGIVTEIAGPRRQKILKPATVILYRAIVHAFLNYCGRPELLTLFRNREIRREVHEIVYLLRSEVEYLLEFVESDRFKLYGSSVSKEALHTYLRLAFANAMRPAEILALRRSDVDDIRGEIVVGRHKTTKTHKERTVFASTDLCVRLKEVLSDDPEQPEAWGFGYDSLYRTLVRLWKEVVLYRPTFPKFRPYTPRYTGAIALIESGFSVTETAEYIGNTPEILIRRYISHKRSDKRKKWESDAPKF